MINQYNKKLTKHRALQCLIVNYLHFLVKEFRPNKKFSKLKRNYNLIFQFPNVSNVNKNENVCLIGKFFNYTFSILRVKYICNWIAQIFPFHSIYIKMVFLSATFLSLTCFVYSTEAGALCLFSIAWAINF